jgi:peptidoglycan hydrolase CwlO-like protein
MDLSIHFLDETVISDTTYDQYHRDDTNVLASGSLTDIINKIKDSVDDINEIISDIKEITQNIEDILQTIKDLKDRLDND